jgi:hypothetical protein
MCDGIAMPWKFSRYFFDSEAIEKLREREKKRKKREKKREREASFSSTILYSADFVAVHMGSLPCLLSAASEDYKELCI